MLLQRVRSCRESKPGRFSNPIQPSAGRNSFPLWIIDGKTVRRPALPTACPRVRRAVMQQTDRHAVQTDFEPNSLKTRDPTTCEVGPPPVVSHLKNPRRFPRLRSLVTGSVAGRQLAFITRCHYNESIDEVRPLQGNFFTPSAPRWAFVFMGSNFVRAVFMRKWKHG